jgi:hypothetical protein
MSLKPEDLAESVQTMVRWLKVNAGGEVTIIVDTPVLRITVSTDPEGPDAALRKALTHAGEDGAPPKPGTSN